MNDSLYSKYRDKCKQYSEEAIKNDPSLTVVNEGTGEYIAFDGYVECDQCGKKVEEDDYMTYGNYGFCSSKCARRFVGI